MVNRLSPRDAMFYFLDEAGSTTHLGALIVLEKIAPDETDSSAAPELDYPSLVTLVENRLQFVPHYRQMVKTVTLGLARPVWVDDPGFDINFHVRRAGLPRPGGYEQLHDLVGRIMSRPLDRKRPLWELYLIEGISDGRLAILTKTHRSLINGVDSLEISEVLLDRDRAPRAFTEDLWMPGSVPGDVSLAMGAVADALARPGEMVDALVSGNGPVSDFRSRAQESVRTVGGFVQQAISGAPESPLNNATTSTRSFTAASVSSTDCALIAQRYECTINDVQLAVITGVMRRWILSSTDILPGGMSIRVALPLSARGADEPVDVDASPSWFADDARGFVTDLPVAEANPMVRLAQVAGLANRYAHSSRRQAQGAQPFLPELGMVPFADFSSRLFSSFSQRTYNLPIAIAEQPISRRYLSGWEVVEFYQVPVLLAQRALAVSVVVYADRVQFGFLGDRGVLADLPSLAGYVTESFDELLAASRNATPSES
ncbi:wax ester/triacylglycerol synthase family O-acyltransferase [Gordonia sp. CPCC 205333]|uniref:wax ester/triacylglycerol synthase family O-acyltransferase n=1 Tax=Gordonia sp. CPCC 205333 TaxID=3140790 RepID=UPI003AF3395C